MKKAFPKEKASVVDKVSVSFFSPLTEGAVAERRLGEFCSLQDSFRHASRATSLTEGGK